MEMTNTHKVLVGNMDGRVQLTDIGVDWSTIIKWIQKIIMVGFGLDSSGSG
jgi:hypothetical protein